MKRFSVLWIGFILPISLQAAPQFLKNFPKESYQKLVSGAQVVGKSALTWSEDKANLVFTEDSTMKLNLFQKQQLITTKMTARTNDQLEIQKFNFEMKSLEAEIKIEGIRLGSNLRLRVEQAGKSQWKEVPLQEPVLLSPMIRPFLVQRGEKNSTLQAMLLEPSALRTIPLTISIQKKSPKNWLVTMKYLSQTMTTEMSATGELLKEKSDLAGLPVDAIPVPKAAYQTLSLEGTKKDLVELAKVPFPTLAKARELKAFSVKVAGVDLAAFELTRHRQVLKGDILKVSTEILPPPSVPVQSLVGQRQLTPFLEGDTAIPVYDPIIQKKAKEIIGKEPDLWKRALLIHEFVFKTLEKVPTISVPNAIEVLSTKRGDCNEHAVLYTALARAAGVPSRIVVGLVYSDRFYGNAGFYYHAWVEVYTGKDWVAIDPTWNQIPADATHLGFVEGSLDRQVQVTALMGKIKLSPASVN